MIRHVLERAACALGLLLVMACVGGPKVPATALGAVEIADLSSNAGALRSATAGDALHLSVWQPEQPPRAVILALHGFGDYGRSTYDKAATYWAGRGFLTYAYDQRGFGHNDSRGNWPGADQLIADYQSVRDAVGRMHPDLPLFVVGHSMGGGIALAGAADDGLAGLVLAAPAVWGGARLALPYRAAAWGGALFAPDKRWTGQGVVTIQASDNIDVLRALSRDPIYLHNPSSREFMGLIRLMDRAVEMAPRISAPTLMLYGERDEVAPENAVIAAYEAIPGQKRLIMYPDGWHLLFRDLQASIVWRDVAEWMEGELP
ncbi:MAG: alpha/beta fold hydrolase [Pseudomonadota bacterium]